MLRLLRQCLQLLPPRRRAAWAALVPVSGLSAAAEAAGAGAVYLLIAALTDPARVAENPTLAALLARLPGPEGSGRLVALTALVAGYYLLKNAWLAAVLYLQQRLAFGTQADLAKALFERYLEAPYDFHLRRDSAALVHRVTEGVRRVVGLVMAPAVAALSEALVVAGILAVLIAASPWVTLAAVAALSALLAALVALTRRRFLALGEREIALGKRALATVGQALDGIKEIRVFGRERHYRERFAAEQEELARVTARHRFLEHVPRFLIESLFVAATLLVVLLLAGRGGGFTRIVPLLGLYAYAGFRIIPSFNRILMHVNSIWYGAASVADLRADLVELPAEADSPAAAPRPAAAAAAGGGAPPAPFTDGVAFERVTFAYDPRRPVLREVGFRVRRGESVALVGATGAGKSTLVDLLLGLLVPTGGRITADGADVRADLAAWRRRIGYVPQAVFLADDSLRRNVAFGIADGEIDGARLAAAVERSGLGEVAAGLPAGLDTAIGERGVRLSGGQRQRVAIARALYHDPELLVFDEATSALDAHAEGELAAALAALHGEKTLLVVAHRLSTIRSCDRVVYLRAGRVAASGTFAELARDEPSFRRTVGIAEGGAEAGAASDAGTRPTTPEATAAQGRAPGPPRRRARRPSEPTG